MNTNWEAVSAVAELTGALAVILTLIYLAVQLRQNSALLKASIAASTRESTNQLTGLLASDREALRVFYAGLEGRESLDERDRQHFDAMLSLYMEALLQSFQQEFDPGLQRADWLICQPGFIEFWELWSDLYSDEFRGHISQRLTESANAPAT